MHGNNKKKLHEQHEPTSYTCAAASPARRVVTADLQATRARNADRRSLADVDEVEANTRFERVSRHERIMTAVEIAA